MYLLEVQGQLAAICNLIENALHYTLWEEQLKLQASLVHLLFALLACGIRGQEWHQEHLQALVFERLAVR
jgi:hypothetical protein